MTTFEATSQGDSATDDGWSLLRAVAHPGAGEPDDRPAGLYAVGDSGELVAVPGPASQAMLRWIPGTGWTAPVAEGGRPDPLLDLYLPFAGGDRGTPVTFAHLGQSLDGFIATAAGDSYYVTGNENVTHLHRMRALADAVIVGAGTIAADDPQLTTRKVEGPNPLRVVIDRSRRLDDQYRVFNDGQAPTLLVCSDTAREPWAATGQVEVLKVPSHQGRLDLAAVIDALHARGCSRIFVEGGGVTVSGFLGSGLLDRVQVAVAPLIIGDGRPALRLPGFETLAECLRTPHRVFRMGDDILFEMVLSASGGQGDATAAAATGIERIL